MAKIKNSLAFLLRPERELGLLLAPSWLSGLAVTVVSLLITVGTFVKLQYTGSSLTYLARLQYEQPQTVSDGYHTVSNSFSGSTLMTELPLFLLWAGIGLILYSLGRGIYVSYQNAVLLEQEMDYVNANRQALVRYAIQRTIIRAVILAAWVLFAYLTLRFLLPYVLAVTYAADGSVTLPESVAYLLWSTGIMAVTLHLHVVLARLLVLKPRIFGSYISSSTHQD